MYKFEEMVNDLTELMTKNISDHVYNHFIATEDITENMLNEEVNIKYKADCKKITDRKEKEITDCFDNMRDN